MIRKVMIVVKISVKNVILRNNFANAQLKNVRNLIMKLHLALVN